MTAHIESPDAGPAPTTESPEADPHARLVEIIELGNEHVIEEDLVEAVAKRLRRFGFAAHVMVRVFDEDCTNLVPVERTRAYKSELEADLSTLTVPAAGSIEGYAATTNQVVESSAGNYPDIDFDPKYINDCIRLIDLGVRTAYVIPLTAQQTVGAISFYGFQDEPFDDRALELAHRAARVLASGIEKCRLLESADAHRIEILRANEQLEASNRDLQDFAYVASHDLQEPLRKIQTFGDRLETKASERLTDAQRADLARMSKASKQMQELINDLLRFSRATTRGGNPDAVDLQSVIETAVESQMASIATSGADIKLGDLPTVWCDEPQLVEVFSTLIANSIKYGQPNQPPVIEIEHDRRRKTASDRVVVIYRDNGIGFEPKFNERVFQPFFRLHTQSEFEGSGIGLAVCERILNRYEGSIRANSRPDNGTVFTLEFALPSASKVAAAGDESVDEPTATSD